MLVAKGEFLIQEIPQNKINAYVNSTVHMRQSRNVNDANERTSKIFEMDSHTNRFYPKYQME